MKILIIGNGGREHAIAWKIAQNEKVEKIYCAPGNGGTVLENKCENVDLLSTCELIEFALKENIDITFVGPEINLALGIVDEFKSAGIKIFGPSGYAAQLEGSKAFAKDFMKMYGVKTAAYETFEDKDEALKYLKNCEYPIVIKADGLAAGKGVSICETYETSEKTVINFMIDDIFKGSGKKIVIEEYLEGVEASILSITDGLAIIPFISAKDHKQIYDNDKGPNTGGMGVIAPNPYCTSEILDVFNKEIMLPTLEGIKAEVMDYIGIIFFGIMITKKGVYNLEYNVRMGDPETQAVLSLMDSDFLELIQDALSQNLSTSSIKWKLGNACCVAAVSEGYPGEYITNYEVAGVDKVNSKTFIAGAKYENQKLRTSGGRVLSVVALGKSIEEARQKAYQDMKKIQFKGIYFRSDIGKV